MYDRIKNLIVDPLPRLLAMDRVSLKLCDGSLHGEQEIALLRIRDTTAAWTVLAEFKAVLLPNITEEAFAAKLWELEARTRLATATEVEFIWSHGDISQLPAPVWLVEIEDACAALHSLSGSTLMATAVPAITDPKNRVHDNFSEKEHVQEDSLGEVHPTGKSSASSANQDVCFPWRCKQQSSFVL